jgi:hypothetical protein
MPHTSLLETVYMGGSAITSGRNLDGPLVTPISAIGDPEFLAGLYDSAATPGRRT